MARQEVVPAASEPRNEPHTLESVHASLTGAAPIEATEQRPEAQAGEVHVGSSGEEGTAEEEAQLEQERLELEVSLLMRNTSRSLPCYNGVANMRLTSGGVEPWVLHQRPTPAPLIKPFNARHPRRSTQPLFQTKDSVSCCPGGESDRGGVWGRRRWWRQRRRCEP